MKDYPSRVSRNENSASVLISLIAGKPIAARNGASRDALLASRATSAKNKKLWLEFIERM
jgi:hypothetical protein